MVQSDVSQRRWGRIWALAAIGALGVLVGLGLFTFGYARGASYFSDDPQTCVNCHVMREQFDAWNHSSHKNVATCNDCHTPHNNLVNKWFIKGLNGFNHSVAFTTGDFHEPITIRDLNATVVQNNCIECHETTVSQILGVHEGEALACVSCHADVGHRTRK
ncbi:MAG: cytochrome c nitrite reductase small subunit [Anaerolineae bacterium]|nr:cytochrome c nitrite reductase small subunit [Anaerolineae bacterium]